MATFLYSGRALPFFRKGSLIPAAEEKQSILMDWCAERSITQYQYSPKIIARSEDKV